MRKLIIATSILVLAAWTEPAEQNEETAVPTEVEAAEPTVANGSPPGTYSDTAADGTLVAEGTWAVVDGKTCFTATTEGQEPMCFTESAPAEDGSFIATPDAGDPVTVRPAAAAAE